MDTEDEVLDFHCTAIGIYQPVRTDDLKPGLESLIGKRMVLSAGWIIDDGPYAGDWAMLVYEIEGQGLWGPPRFGWGPHRDFAELRRVPVGTRLR